MQTPTIDLELGGRKYGGEVSLDERYDQVADTEVFRATAAGLRSQSRLLMLRLTPELTKDTIFDAYANDLELLMQYRREFEACICKAIRCSIVRKGISNAEKETERAWSELQAEIPAIGQAPLLLLSSDRAGQDVDALFHDMQEEVGAGIGRLMKLFAYWLQMLAEAEFIGLVEWSGLDVARYHYFKQEIENTATEKDTTARTIDESQPFGERTTDIHRHSRREIHRRFRERHVHHIIRAKLYSLTEYPLEVPMHVAEFLEGVPAWLRPHLQIVEGTITLEEKHRKTLVDSDVETVRKSVVKYSPGVLCAPFNLIGWSGDDMTSVRPYQGQTAAQLRVVARQREWIRQRLPRIISWGVGAAVVVTVVVWGVATLIRNDMNAREQARVTYVAQHTTNQTVMETKKGNRIELPVPARQVYFSGKLATNGTVVSFTSPSGVKSTVQPRYGMKLQDDRFGQYRLGDDGYGDVDLGPDFGIFVKLRVLSVFKDTIRYVAETYGH